MYKGPVQQKMFSIMVGFNLNCYDVNTVNFYNDNSIFLKWSVSLCCLYFCMSKWNISSHQEQCQRCLFFTPRENTVYKLKFPH
jgi:hypothetical protein